MSNRGLAWRPLARGLAVAGATFAIDVSTKTWATQALSRAPLRLVPGVLELELSFNPGAAFGFLGGYAAARVVIVAGALLGFVVLIRAYATLDKSDTRTIVGTGLVAGGALGNLYDRILRGVVSPDSPEHAVVDFIGVWLAPGRRWPAFNLADVALVVGIGALALAIARRRTIERHARG